MLWIYLAADLNEPFVVNSFSGNMICLVPDIQHVGWGLVRSSKLLLTGNNLIVIYHFITCC